MSYFKIVVENKHRGIPVVLAALDIFMRQLGAVSEEKEGLKTATKEALENAINYAYPNKKDDETLITVTAMASDNVVTVTIKDKGVGISNIEEARKPMYTTGGNDRSGMGFTIMESFMTTFSVTSVPGKGTTVHMRRKLQSRK